MFQVEAGTYHVGVQNSFLSFAPAHDGRAFGFVSCGVTFGSWQEAEDSKNAFIAQRRNAGDGVSLANWAYYGD